MKTKLSLIGVLASLLLGACSKSIVLNDYVIVKPAAATATEAKAASELQKYLFEISGAELPVVSDTAPPTDREILIGITNRLRDDSLARFGEDGFVHPYRRKAARDLRRSAPWGTLRRLHTAGRVFRLPQIHRRTGRGAAHRKAEDRRAARRRTDSADHLALHLYDAV